MLWLQGSDSYGDVMAESRGKKANKMLVESYARLYQRGADYVSAKMFQKRLTTKKLKIREKSANVAGLQLADLIANPCMRSLVCERKKTEMPADFGARVVEIIKKNKYRRSYDGAGTILARLALTPFPQVGSSVHRICHQPVQSFLASFENQQFPPGETF